MEILPLPQNQLKHMNKIAWISLILFILVWYLFGKVWLAKNNDGFKFSDRDKSMVFPIEKTSNLDLDAPTPTLLPPTLETKSGTDTSQIKP